MAASTEGAGVDKVDYKQQYLAQNIELQQMKNQMLNKLGQIDRLEALLAKQEIGRASCRERVYSGV